MAFLKRLFGSRRAASETQVARLIEMNEQLAQFLGVTLFQRCVEFVSARRVNGRVDSIAVHMKLSCTGEGPNEKSMANSTLEERELAEALAAEVMATSAKGFYWLPVLSIAEHVKSLPPTAQSIKSLALTAARQIALAHMASATDLSHEMNQPVIDREYVRARTLPLLLNIARYDGDSSVLQTDIAQTYFTLGDIPSGTAAAKIAVELDPSNGEAWRLVGNSHLAVGNDAEARKCFERALTLNPTLDGAREALKLLNSQ